MTVNLRLSFAAVFKVLHVGDGNHQVHVQPQLIEVSLTEQFYVRGLELLVLIAGSVYMISKKSAETTPQRSTTILVPQMGNKMKPEVLQITIPVGQ
ncbi:hypothetical protein EYF80_027765 [Liparis tanakae]|uniref:Uncharacterized protein n=1 Tax=Liparis tanakae TaxID=230148 RepID=A0A4Z2H7Y6_9TELE|nr:hypothetical protein EYF80_027765 [Liparis tanakae]